MLCPLLRISSGQEGVCLESRCAWWLEAEGGGCAIVWVAVWLERMSSRIGT